jgi:DNA-binding HxlR family transcriptional regulator
MRRASLADMACSVARSLDVVGEWWTLLVLRDVFYGLHRFDEIARDLGIARNVLAARLATLTEHGILDRVRYCEHPPRDEYRLTAKGRDLFGVLLALLAWGDRWLAGEEGPPVTLTHRPCGAEVTPRVTCDHCGGELSARDVAVAPRPGQRLPGPAGQASPRSPQA